MQLFPAAFTLTLTLLIAATGAHNITRILAKHPEFSTFNHYLTITHLAAEINRRQTITVCAVDNSAMSELLSKGFSLYTVKNVLSLHVFADYFGAKKLHQITKGSTLTATMFQATGEAPGTSGYVNITDMKGGKVAFGAEDNGGQLTSHFVKSIHEMPYNISVIQISNILNSVEAEAPTASPTDLNVTSLMSKQGCKAFSDLLLSTGAADTFRQTADGGLTVFCPSDPALKSFMPKYNNLTKSGKTALLLYHGVPVYQSMQTLKSNNGLMNTLATDGAETYDFTVQNDGEDIKLETEVVTATVTGTLADEEPVVLYKIDKVLEPTELFKTTKKAKAKGKKEEEAEAPGPSDDDYSDDSEDQTADKNGAGRFNSVGGVLALAIGLCLMVVN